MQTASAGAEIDVGGLAGFFGAAIPQTSAAENALFPVKLWHTALAAGNRLAGTHFHAKFRLTVATDIRAKEHHMIGISWRRLHAAAGQQGILLGHQKFPIEWNFRPAAAVHD